MIYLSKVLAKDATSSRRAKASTVRATDTDRASLGPKSYSLRRRKSRTTADFWSSVSNAHVGEPAGVPPSAWLATLLSVTSQCREHDTAPARVLVWPGNAASLYGTGASTRLTLEDPTRAPLWSPKVAQAHKASAGCAPVCNLVHSYSLSFFNSMLFHMCYVESSAFSQCITDGNHYAIYPRDRRRTAFKIHSLL